jgi:hypothetical protein
MARNKDDDNILYDLYACFLGDLPVPPRVAQAFVRQFQKGNEGDIRSWDEVFGKPTPPGLRKKIERRTAQGRLVADAVERLKAEGGSLNEEAFEAIGRATGVGGKTKVKELLGENRFWAERVNRLLELGREISKNYRR